MGRGPERRKGCHRAGVGKHGRSAATNFLAGVRAMQLNAELRPLCPTCTMRRLVLAEDRAANKCLTCRLIEEAHATAQKKKAEASPT